MIDDEAKANLAYAMAAWSATSNGAVVSCDTIRHCLERIDEAARYRKALEQIVVFIGEAPYEWDDYCIIQRKARNALDPE